MPGTILADRYRIVTMLGQGGMGEVYRAEDLRLAQSVALKFLPEQRSQDAASLARFHQEVRLARQITHPSVCRVFDIGDADGLLFLSMELIDGEDLASLLRRIGRLPVSKALDIAKQLCAGLAAIHENGVLHRDLKPANVMIDGRGRAHITDFGISALSAEGGQGRSRAGSPAYMAPEQHAGERLSVQTDLFALGLVMYEMLTGRRAFLGSTPQEIAESQREGKPPSPSALVPEIDARTEVILLKCLERDPALRPGSAQQVAVALPGLDPLSAAVAAGETPSPEMVAASPKAGRLSPGVAWTCLTAIGLLSTALMWTYGRFDLVHRVGLERSPEVMADRARQILASLGYEEPPVARAFWYAPIFETTLRQRELLNSGRAREARELYEGRAPLMVFVYRERPGPLLPQGPELSGEDPPLIVPGEAFVYLDLQGRLCMLQAGPVRSPRSRAVNPPDWKPLLAAAGIDPRDLSPAEIRSVLPGADARAGWTGIAREPGRSPVPVHLEAASDRGVVVFFGIDEPEFWPSEALREVGKSLELRAKLLRGLFYFFYLTVVIGSLLLVRRNLRLGRGDPRSALRLATAIFVFEMVNSVLLARGFWLQAEDRFWLQSVGRALTQASLVWIGFVGLEPFLRRFWPERIISWTRLLGGSLRDPLVGRDILAGCLFGVGLRFVFSWRTLTQLALYGDGQSMTRYEWISSTSFFLSFLVKQLQASLLIPLCFLVFLLALRVLLRRMSMASLVVWFLLTVVLVVQEPPVTPWADWAISAVSSALLVLTWTRFGLLAGVVQWWTFYLASGLSLAADPSAWFAGRGFFALLIILGPALYGLVTSTAGQVWFRDHILEN